MPRRKRHFTLCKAGLHDMSKHGRIKELPTRVFARTTYVIRYCFLCRVEAIKKETESIKRKRLQQ